MDDASVANCDESSSEDNNCPGNGILLDIVNGCHLTHSSSLAKAVAGEHLQLDESVKSEDLLNNNKEALEQDCFTNQRFVSTGDFTTVSDQTLVAHNLKESFLTSSKDRNSTEHKETLNHLHESCQTTDKGKEQGVRGLYNSRANQALSNYTLKKNVCKDISGNNEISQAELQNEALRKETHNSCTVDLLKFLENPVDEDKRCAIESIVGDGPQEKECSEKHDFKQTAVSESCRIKRDSLDEVTKHNIESTSKILDHRPQGCDKRIHADNNVNNRAAHLKSGGREIPTAKQKVSSSMEHYDILANTVCDSEDGSRNCSVDSQTKRFGLCLPKNGGSRRNKRKKEHRSRKCGRLQPVSHELEFVEEEDLSEKEESSEEDNIDNSFHYSCSKDGLDHRKERHQYVSDKLDPDVLQLLEMHLRKQQLVDIKEEGEEEMIDVHINKEKSRADSYKLLRNIPPVLDMVLEEPELEHAGDMLEDDSKTPSDIDSDDSSNVSSMEIGLMESLQYDLISKSSKIDKHEIATILQGPSPDYLSKGTKTKQNEGALHHSECKSKHGNIQIKAPKAHDVQMRIDTDLQVIDEDEPEHVESGMVSKDIDAVEDITNTLVQPETSNSDSNSLKDGPEQPLGLNERESVEPPVFVNPGRTEPFQADQPSDLASLDHSSDVTQQNASDQVDEVKLLDISALNSLETALPDSKVETASGSPCPTFAENVKPHVHCLESTISSEDTDSCNPDDGGDFRMENDSSEQHNGIDRVLTSQAINLTDVIQDLNVIKADVKSQTESSLSEASLSVTADMNTQRTDLKQKISSLLEKAHAADCRSSRLQAEAELLFKESIELRNECKSLSKEAAELLSIFTQQEVLNRHPIKQNLQEVKEDGLCTSDTKPNDKETLSFVSNRTSKKKKKAESQLQMLSKKYSFLRQEAPDIMRELHVLQQDLKNLPPHHSESSVSFLYKWLWGGLMAGGTMLLVWWSTKHLG